MHIALVVLGLVAAACGVAVLLDTANQAAIIALGLIAAGIALVVVGAR